MATGIQKYIDGAVEVLDRFGIKVKEEDSALANILKDISYLDEPKVMALAKVLGYEGSFNRLVRDNVEEMNIGTRYEKVTNAFDSIVDDANMLVHELDDGKIDTKEKLQNLWMRISRGTPHKRFEVITKTHKEVSDETKNQLDREDAISDAYIDFRLCYADGRTIALELLKVQEARLKAAEGEAATAGEAVGKYMKAPDRDDIELSKLQKTRDEKVLNARREDSNYQLLKDMAEGMSNGYNVGETLIAKLMQTHEAKNQVYRRNAIFFTTNEHVFTTLDAVFTSQLGLHEATQEMEAEKRVLNKGLEAVAELGTQLETAALKAGYGSTTNPESVKKLVDAVVNYQIQSREMIKQLREESAKQTKEVEAIVEDGKRRVAETVTKYQTATA